MPRPGLVLRLIALFKLFKAALLVAIGLGTLHLVRAGLADDAQRWLETLAINSGRASVQRLVSLVSGLSPRRLEVLAVVAFLYAGLYLLEGVGVWFEKRWAEYLIAIVTLLFVPFEVLALMHRVSPTRLAALILNLAVAAYMIHKLREDRVKG